MQFSFTQIKTRIMLIRRDCIQYLNSELQATKNRLISKEDLGINLLTLTGKVIN